MATTTWILDASHSELQFKVKHLMISSVTGQFNRFESTVETEDDDFTTAKVQFSAEVDSISTNNEQRDGHLKNNDFFDAANHPKLTFTSNKMERVADDEFRLEGDLTIRGVTKKVKLNVEFGGTRQDPWGNTRSGFTITGKINRQDFGVSFGAVMETGGLLLDNEVKISANVQYVKQAVAELV